MSRPRKPHDPTRWPVPCARCGENREIATVWPDGGVCGYCYQQAKRTRGRCACGHEGVLPGRLDGQPSCRSCSGVRLNVDCTGCGAEDELYTGTLCWACVLAATVDQVLTDSTTGTIRPQLQPFAAALKAMKRANSGLTWIRQPHVTTFLQSLATATDISHATVDALPASQTREFVRGLLEEHGVLPRRDRYRARFQDWSTAALDRLEDPAHIDVVRRYIRWQHLRRMNQMTEVPQGTFLRSKQTVTVAIQLLNWLHARGVPLAELEQHDLDVWQATGPSTRLMADRFLTWAIRSKLVHPELSIRRHRRGTSPRLSAEEQTHAVHHVVHTEHLGPRERTAAILVLVFGQQMQDVVTLTWDDVTLTEELVTVRIAGTSIALPSPLDEPWRALAVDPGHDTTATHPSSNWVYRGGSPGRHLDPGHLRHRLSEHFGTRAARLGTLHELTKLAPVAILADALGYSPATIERHAADSATAYSRYIATIREK